jgi:hypothetical protein
MRAFTFAIAFMLATAGLASAQDWIEYQNIEDGFKLDFPGQPKITDTFWATEQGYIIPARIYSAQEGASKYSMTVVDYTVIDRLGMIRSQRCPVGAETCQGQPSGGLRNAIGPGYGIQDIRDAIVFATFKYISKPGITVSDYLWNWEDLVEGHELHITNADGSRTFVFIAMRENRLYVMDATVPKGYPEPGLFHQSLGWVDPQGRAVRYNQIYVNEIHGLRIDPPPGYGGQNGPPPAAAQAPAGAPVNLK